MIESVRAKQPKWPPNFYTIDIKSAEKYCPRDKQSDLSLKPEPTFDVKYVADAVLYMAGLPLEANVLFMTVMATKMPYIGRG